MLEEWLAAADLSHRLPAFRAHQIEYHDLGDLTEAELRELGLTIGERKRFQRALAAGAASLVSAERRPLTLAFFDLVGSSALSERLDAEDLVELLRAYRERCCAAVERFGGHVAHLMGDGVLAYFCYPVAHENDAERAVRAAVEITRTVQGIAVAGGQRLAVRCGIATGRVIVTELFSGRAADKRAVAGSTPNLAARLQALAPANGIILSEATHRRVQSLFDCEDLGPIHLKGFTRVVPAFRVRRERPMPLTLDEGQHASLAPFVGRGVEADRLLAAWQRTVEGVGGLTTLVAEAGMGKSRLLGRFLQQADTNRVVRLNGSSLDEHSPLRPFLAYLNATLAVGGTRDRTDLVLALRELMPEANATALRALATFFEPANRSTAAVDTTIDRAGALEALVEHVAGLAVSAPVLVIVEDAHWFDPTSMEVLGQLAARAPDRRLLVVVTARPGAAAMAALSAAHRPLEVRLGPLGKGEVETLVRLSFGDEPVPQEVVERIVERTDGVPLFVEALIRPLLEGSLAANWFRLIADRDQPTMIPATLHEALAERLDQLGDAKTLAQTASVVGLAVDAEVLGAVCGCPTDQVRERLLRLVAADILRRTPGLDQTSYTFSHVLLRDAAYDGLLREQRQELHGRAAAALMRLRPELVEKRPDILARHLAEAGRVMDALPYWLAAGRAAAERSALHEARHVLEVGAALAEHLPQTPDIIALRLEFASLLGPVLFALSGPGSPESRAVYETAVALAEALPKAEAYFPLLWGWWRLSKDFRVKADRARRLLRLANARPHQEMRLQAHHCNWASTFHAADFKGCRFHIEEGLRLYDNLTEPSQPWLYGNHDAKTCAHGELAQVLWMQGDGAAASQQERAALQWAARCDHAGTITHGYDNAMLLRYYRRDVPGTRAIAEQMIAFAEDQGMTEPRARGQLFLGWARAHAGDPAAGLVIFEDGYRRQRAVGTDEDTPVYACMFAEILNLLGRHDRALRELHEVAGELERFGIANWLPEIWRLIGETSRLAYPNDRDAVREALRLAGKLAERQGVPALGLRIAVTRSRFDDGFDPEAKVAAVERLRRAIRDADHCIDLQRADAVLRDWAAREAPRPVRTGRPIILH